MFFFFFFNDTATTEIYTLSLHDALPISNRRLAWPRTPDDPRRAIDHEPDADQEAERPQALSGQIRTTSPKSAVAMPRMMTCQNGAVSRSSAAAGVGAPPGGRHQGCPARGRSERDTPELH